VRLNNGCGTGRQWLRDIHTIPAEQADTHTYRQRHTYIHTYRHTYIHTYRETGIHTDRQTGRQRGRDMQTDGHAQKGICRHIVHVENKACKFKVGHGGGVGTLYSICYIYIYI